MKCYTVDGSGFSGLKIDEKTAPSVGEHDVLVGVRNVSLNYRDILVATGKYGSPNHPPFIPCSDMSGVVLRVGDQVSGFKPGDKVINGPFRYWPGGSLRSEWARTFVGGSGVDGVLADQISYPACSLVKMPSHLTFAQGATLTIAGLTAWAGLVTHGKIRPGEWVLLQGTGGVSLFGAQLAKMMGARVILMTSNVEKANQVNERLGIDYFLDYRDPDWPEKVKQLTEGKGVDVVLEVAGGDNLKQSMKACNYGARISLVGILSGVEALIDIRQMLSKQIAIRGIFMESSQELQAFSSAVEANRLIPYVDRIFSFDDVQEAYQHVADGKHIGKVVIHVFGSE